MRVFGQCVAFVFAIGMVAQAGTPGRPAGQAKDAATILAAARQALGGEKKLSAVKSFTATGRTRQVRGDNLVPIEFEISVELPDKYLRKDEIPAQESGPNASGFNGSELLQDPPPPPAPAPPPAMAGRDGARGAAPGGPPRNPSAARVTALEQDFARLTLGMFATSFAGYPLTFTYVGEAEAPQGKADVIDAKGAGNFTLRLFINTETHLPIMVSWQGAPAGRGGRPGGPGGPGGPAGVMPAPSGAVPAGVQPPAAGAGAPVPPPAGAGAPVSPPAGDRGAPPAAAAAGRGPAVAPVENRLYFAEYHDVDGLQFPFRLRRAVGTDTIEETIFDRFKINAKIDPKKFEVKK